MKYRLGEITSWVLAIAGLTLEEAHQVLSIAAFVGSVAVSVVTLFVLLKRYRNERLDNAKKQAELCAGCVAGAPPLHCPLPEADRPKMCPRNFV